MGIYVWGTGCGASELFKKGLLKEHIAAFVDTHPIADAFLGKPVLTPEQLPIEEVELLLVASRHTQSVLSTCLALGLKRDVLFFTKNRYQLQDINAECITAAQLLGSSLVDKLQEPCQIIREPRMKYPEILTVHDKSQDYVRIKTLELLAASVQNVPGAIAELGVYKGDFARLLNLLFPTRKLYLFDSFQGFEPQEAARELNSEHCGTDFINAHANTSVPSVLKKMPYPDLIDVREGYFPFSAGNLNEHFALVSLDVDFEETTYTGLSWFWPRLNPGGYLLLHDYNSPDLSGVKAALLHYEMEHNTHLPGVPLCDINGTLVLCKPGVFC
ncbi:MAG: macrocin O-methyltransferase [Lachnospiraceae bacterium]|nr:macrocin O-methyltransferase [Lachnospiraceae bacterium]